LFGFGNRLILGACGRSYKVIIEQNFLTLEKYDLIFLRKNDLDYEPKTIIRREILPSVNQRAFINDSPVHLSFITLGIV